MRQGAEGYVVNSRWSFLLVFWLMLGATLGIGASVDLVDAEVVAEDQTSSVTFQPAGLAPAPVVVDPAAPVCPYPGGNCPTTTLTITVRIDGMLSGGEVFPYSFECTGTFGAGAVTQEQLFAGGGEVTITASNAVLIGGQCSVSFTEFSTTRVFGPVTVPEDGVAASFTIEAG